jgi:hypothetical protein
LKAQSSQSSNQQVFGHGCLSNGAEKAGLPALCRDGTKLTVGAVSWLDNARILFDMQLEYP